MTGSAIWYPVPVPSKTTDDGQGGPESQCVSVHRRYRGDTEFSRSTVYRTVLFFGPDGKLLGKHRNRPQLPKGSSGARATEHPTVVDNRTARWVR